MDPISIAAITLALAAMADGYPQAPKESKLRQLIDFLAAQAAMIHNMRKMGPDRYTSVVDYILDRGKYYQAQELSQEQLDYLDQVMERSGYFFAPRECFSNAQYALLFDVENRMAYVEGYAHGQAPIPVHHGWLTIDGAPVEITWRDHSSNRSGPMIQPKLDFAYFGVEFDRDDLARQMFEKQFLGTVIDDWEAGWPELQKPRKRAFPVSD
jgi:hypothetical protein